jgi:DNA transformation protein
MSREFAEHVVDLLQNMGPVDARSMFGGYGIYLDGLMFGLIADEVLYLKVDDENRPEFEELGLGPFVYEGKNRSVTMSYSEAPPNTMDDAELLAQWGAGAYAAAQRAKR